MCNFINSPFSTLMVFFLLTGPFLKKDNITDKTLKNETISFDVLRKNSSVGFLTLKKWVSSDKVIITAESEVNAKLILNFKAVGSDKCIFRNNRLVYSSQFRKINNKISVDQSISYHDGKYLFKENEKESILNIQLIELNIMPLFFSEPKNIHEVYSDKFRQKVKVDSLGNGSYKILLPNGESSVYHYKNGSCMSVDVSGIFYKVKLIKKNS